MLHTASADNSACVWDTALGQLRVSCETHAGSVKVVTPHTSAPDIFATGGSQKQQPS